MGLKVYLDGRLVDEKDAKISVFDHGLLYGDGLFEGIRAYNGRVFRLDEHLDRLYDGAKALKLQIPLTKAEMTDALIQTLRANSLTDAYIRMVVTRGIGDLGLDPQKCPKPSVFIITASIVLYPEQFYENGLHLITCSTRRNHPAALDGGIKSLNYLNNIFAKMETTAAGVPEGIMLSTDGYVAECTGDNIFLVTDGKLITPPLHVGNLAGITRDAVIELAEAQGMETTEELFRIKEVHIADECFLTGTAAEVVPAVVVDGRPIGDGKPGPVTKSLREAFVALTSSEGTPIE